MKRLKLLIWPIVAALFACILTACAAKKYTITFDAGGGSEIAAITQEEKTAVVAPADPLREGYIFEGWTLNGESYTISEMPSENITLVADWTLAEYAVTFVADGETVATEKYTVEDKTISEPAVPVKEGHSGAWESYTLTTGDKTVNAVYTAIRYTISFDGEGGSETAAITQDYGTAIAAPVAPTRTGYDFAGWDKEIPATMPAENLTLKATWTPTVYTIVYETNGGTVDGVNPTSYTIESETVTLLPAEKKGYSFVGWLKDETPAPVTGIPQGSTGNITLSAAWLLETYTIAYHLDGAKTSGAIILRIAFSTK